MPVQVLSEFKDAEGVMRRYLLGERGLAPLVRNHIFFLVQGDIVSAKLAGASPNFMIRTGVGGYALWTTDGYSAVIHNLAGVFCVTLIRGCSRDTWRNTKVSPEGGRIKQPQQVKSWIANDFFEAVIEFSKSNDGMSERQQYIIQAAVARNPNAASLRFREADQRLRIQ